MTTVGLISPGDMGASVGAAATRHADVIWAGAERGPATHERAKEAGLRDCGDLRTLCSEADIILSICPPHDARSVAASVLDSGFTGTFVEGNAISPGSCLEIAGAFNADCFVDGGIVGGPAWQHDSGTTLYLSGGAAPDIEALFTDTPLKTHIISGDVGAASAMKMVFAAYTKGSTALLAAILGVADHYDVRDTLEAQWGERFSHQTHQRLTGNSVKAWRFAGEMREIAQTFAEAGQSAGFHEAAADTFERLAEFKDGPAADIETLLEALNRIRA